MSKYIDLEPQVSDYYGTSPGQERRAGICDALRFLDSHPEQVPGRTITESELRRLIHKHLPDETTEEQLFMLMADLGITVVPDPDPEPTNAEKLTSLYERWRQDTDGMGISVGAWMEKHGVKAPGGDDE